MKYILIGTWKKKFDFESSKMLELRKRIIEAAKKQIQRYSVNMSSTQMPVIPNTKQEEITPALSMGWISSYSNKGQPRGTFNNYVIHFEGHQDPPPPPNNPT